MEGARMRIKTYAVVLGLTLAGVFGAIAQNVQQERTAYSAKDIEASIQRDAKGVDMPLMMNCCKKMQENMQQQSMDCRVLSY
jgi:hypothetical protein